MLASTVERFARAYVAPRAHPQRVETHEHPTTRGGWGHRALASAELLTDSRPMGDELIVSFLRYARARCAKSFALLLVSLAACGPSELRHAEEDAPADRGDGATSPRDAAGAPVDAGEDSAFDPEWSVIHRVAVLNFAPRIEGSPLFEWAGWNDPSAQASDYASSMHAASHGAITYEIVDWLELDAFPIKADGFGFPRALSLRAVSAPRPRASRRQPLRRYARSAQRRERLRLREPAHGERALSCLRAVSRPEQPAP
jgi:hypothetical protein